MKAVIYRPGTWLMLLVAGLLAYCAVPAPAGLLEDEPPASLVATVMGFPLVEVETCTLSDLGLTAVECFASYDSKRRESWLLLFDDNMKINMVVLYDGATHVLWCKSTACT